MPGSLRVILPARSFAELVGPMSYPSDKKKFLLYITHPQFIDEPKKSRLVNSLLKEYYENEPVITRKEVIRIAGGVSETMKGSNEYDSESRRPESRD